MDKELFFLGGNIWPDGKIPFVFREDFIAEAGESIYHNVTAAMAHINSSTAVQFVDKIDEEDYVVSTSYY